jgi:hypothetical protein
MNNIDPATDQANTLKFHKHLEQSQDAVWKAAKWLQSNGKHVLITPMTKTPTHSEWHKHADSGDLYIQQRIEVKRRSVHFTGPEDWPHGDKFFVCAKHSWDRAKPKPHAYLIFNTTMTTVAIVLGDSYPLWFVERREDRRYEKYSQEFYVCRTDDPCIRWVHINSSEGIDQTTVCEITGEKKTIHGEYVF